MEKQSSLILNLTHISRYTNLYKMRCFSEKLKLNTERLFEMKKLILILTDYI